MTMTRRVREELVAPLSEQIVLFRPARRCLATRRSFRLQRGMMTSGILSRTARAVGTSPARFQRHLRCLPLRGADYQHYQRNGMHLRQRQRICWHLAELRLPDRRHCVWRRLHLHCREGIIWRGLRSRLRGNGKQSGRSLRPQRYHGRSAKLRGCESGLVCSQRRELRN